MEWLFKKKETDEEKMEKLEKEIFEEQLAKQNQERAAREAKEKRKIDEELQKEYDEKKKQIDDDRKHVEESCLEEVSRKKKELDDLRRANASDLEEFRKETNRKHDEEIDEIRSRLIDRVKQKKLELENKREKIRQLDDMDGEETLETFEVRILAEEEAIMKELRRKGDERDENHKNKLRDLEKQSSEYKDNIEERMKRLSSGFRSEQRSQMSFVREMSYLKMLNHYALTEAFNKEDEFEKFREKCHILIDNFAEFKRCFDEDQETLLAVRDDMEVGVKSMCDLSLSLKSLDAFAMGIGDFNAKNQTNHGNVETLGKTLGKLAENLKDIMKEISNKAKRYEKNFEQVEHNSSQPSSSIKELYDQAKQQIATVKETVLQLNVKFSNEFDQLLEKQKDDLEKRIELFVKSPSNQAHGIEFTVHDDDIEVIE